MVQRGAASLESVGRRIAEGDHEAAAEQFVDEVALGPGAWAEQVPAQLQAVFIDNAPTFLDELRDPDQMRIDQDRVARLDLPVRFTQGSESPPTFAAVIDRLTHLLPRASRETIDGAGHVPHLTAPERFVEATARGIVSAAD